RKSLADLAGSLTTGKLTYALAELAALPRAAVVVEDRYSALFKLEHVSAGAVADALAEAQARFPAVPVVFTETRPLAQESTYRFLGAALRELRAHAAPAAAEVFAPQDDVPGVGGVVAAAARATRATKPRGDGETAAVRAWAQAQGYTVADRGRIAADVVRAYREQRG
ncbi:histone-like nucleoid-structuring protein Lsr2, partial [Georgenia yuyongxinii]|uniref:Lsr2 family DNA-binding protein n=1 Tax=Georgenia yuyongxinii TaxID=2589797 RepID=UPI003637BD09